ncbi:hypothetical protein LOC71_15575 [Rhodopirellula sp. JC740]|uniref:Uncharacterized protein n=1 Tax=Rhodopirellula halodulae TaxID=2894198 RepID=A0ABS8NJH0_9BACT|nr:hypothetical protein [Rhodopirellula sp. JC740]MCC9643705.1 hypothetical protein [Rhodopirellula sp. JC740]
MNDQNPYQTTIEISPDPYNSTGIQYGGIGRTAFIVGYIGIIVAQWALALIAVRFTDAGAGQIGLPLQLISGVATIALAWYRMINQGSSGFWALGVIVPLLNLFVILRCMCCPMGYADDHKLDTAGKIVGATIFVLFILFVVLIGMIFTRF